jgi:hypothetical protein
MWMGMVTYFLLFAAFSCLLAEALTFGLDAALGAFGLLVAISFALPFCALFRSGFSASGSGFSPAATAVSAASAAAAALSTEATLAGASAAGFDTGWRSGGTITYSGSAKLPDAAARSTTLTKWGIFATNPRI